MRTIAASVALCLYLCLSSLSVAQAPATSAVSAVPRLVNYSGMLKNVAGHQIAAATGVTFLIYKDEQGGAPLWLETQTVTPDRSGHYAVQLGAASRKGLPADLFAANEARWLAVQVANEAEQPRTLLVAVPYAMKAADAATIGGLPPSAFVLAAPVAAGNGATGETGSSGSAGNSGASPASAVTTTGGTVNAIPLFTTATNIQHSILTQTASTAVNVGGKLNLPATGTATATAGKNSRPEALVASAFNSGTSTAVPQTFQLQAEPAGNNTANASGTLNLLYGSGTTVPAETGLKISSKGLLTFAVGQAFPGTLTGITTAAGSGLSGGGTTGTLSLKLLTTCAANQILKWSGTAWACAGDANSGGTVKSAALTAPASDFTVSGSPVTTTGTLGLAWTVAPTNTNTANAIVKRDATGSFSATSISTSGTVSAVDLSATDLSSSATTILGKASSTTGDAWGVAGYTYSSAANAYGVIGFAAPFTGSAIGTYGLADSPVGIGVFGQLGTESATGQGISGATGVWGDGGTGGGFGVLGTTGDAVAGFFVNSGTSTYALEGFASDPAGYPLVAINGSNQYCDVDPSGNLNCSGSKNAVVPVDGGKRTVAMSAIESPVNWFEDAGSARLVNGAATVELDPTFIQTVNTQMEYHVFPVPYGDCKGLYVTNRTATSFEVRELGGGTANLSFGYRIMAVRKNYETVRFADHTREREMVDQELARRKAAAAHRVSHDPGRKVTGTPLAMR